jgi:hypothetical protein
MTAIGAGSHNTSLVFRYIRLLGALRNWLCILRIGNLSQPASQEASDTRE